MSQLFWGIPFGAHGPETATPHLIDKVHNRRACIARFVNANLAEKVLPDDIRMGWACKNCLQKVRGRA